MKPIYICAVSALYMESRVRCPCAEREYKHRGVYILYIVADGERENSYRKGTDWYVYVCV